MAERKAYIHRFSPNADLSQTSKEVADREIADHPEQYPVGEFCVLSDTFQVYVAVGAPSAWVLVGSQV